MEAVSLTDRLLRRPLAYRAWQAPFAGHKFSPILAQNDLSKVRRVLDLGCGPGTNRGQFRKAEYVGIDINPSYLAHASAKDRGVYIVADASRLPLSPSWKFDFILINSLLHHIPTTDVRSLLQRVSESLAAEGHVHILDLVRPERTSLARLLARADRGAYARSRDEWIGLFEEHFRASCVQSYSIGIPGVPLWHMIYFKGRNRS